MIFTESQFKKFAEPLSQSEKASCLRAINMVKGALEDLAYTELEPLSNLFEEENAYMLKMQSQSKTEQITIFIQGSYANNTNIRGDSDVDIAVVRENVFFPIFRSNQTNANYGFVNAGETPKQFKDTVQKCLLKKFGYSVQRKNKSIKVHGNSYRKDADVVPCNRQRDYRGEFLNNSENFIGGIVIFSDEGEKIVNYPEQHIKNGRAKNVETNYFYKKIVRIAKNIKSLMSEQGLCIANEVSSFALESLLWNIPSEVYLLDNASLINRFRLCLAYLKKHSSEIEKFKEANGIKNLCQTTEMKQNLIKFIQEMHQFVQYQG